MKYLRIILLPILILLLPVLIIVGQLGYLKGKRPALLGVNDGRLQPPPSKPNCVCSQANLYPPTMGNGSLHQIDPLRFTGDADTAWKKLQAVIKSNPAAQLITTKHDYLHAEYTSSLLKFVDDVEFMMDPVAQVIHVRSASRIGYSDFGVNRKRVEDIRAAFGSGA